MSSWSNHAEERILRLLLGQSVNAPSNIYAGGLLSNPGDTGLVQEISYEGYERQPVTFSEPTASTGSATMTNTNIIQFPESNSSAGTIQYYGLFDSLIGGNMWAYVATVEGEEGLEVTPGVAPLVSSGDMQITSSGNLSTEYRLRTLNLLRGANITGFTPYFALFNGNPDSSGSAELAGDNYARFGVVFGAPAEQASGQMMISNSAAASGPRSGDNWGTWTHDVIFDAQSGGYPVISAPRPGSVQVRMNRGRAAGIKLNQVSFSID